MPHTRCTRTRARTNTRVVGHGGSLASIVFTERIFLLWCGCGLVALCCCTPGTRPSTGDEQAEARRRACHHRSQAPEVGGALAEYVIRVLCCAAAADVVRCDASLLSPSLPFFVCFCLFCFFPPFPPPSSLSLSCCAVASRCPRVVRPTTPPPARPTPTATTCTAPRAACLDKGPSAAAPVVHPPRQAAPPSRASAPSATNATSMGAPAAAAVRGARLVGRLRLRWAWGLGLPLRRGCTLTPTAQTGWAAGLLVLHVRVLCGVLCVVVCCVLRVNECVAVWALV